MPRSLTLLAGAALAALIWPAAGQAQSPGEIQAMFGQMDGDGNGEITPAEMTTMMGGMASPGMVRMNIIALDADGSGGLSESEFSAISQMSNGRPTEAQMKRVFDSFDTDKSAAIDRSELTQAMQDLDQYEGEVSVDEAMTEADLNGDDQITFTEFQQIPG
ncbi:MAG: EF-hand domain-containing protein [Pseudomonadota bacterium]